MSNIDAREYYKIKNNPEVITIDVRTALENKQLQSMPWAINIEIDDLLQNYEKYLPDKSKTIITVCNAGNRSGEAALFLKEHGYEKAYVLNGGIYHYYREFKD